MKVDLNALSAAPCVNCGVPVIFLEVWCTRCVDPRRTGRGCSDCTGTGFVRWACERVRVVERAVYRWRMTDGLAVHHCRGRR